MVNISDTFYVSEIYLSISFRVFAHPLYAFSWKISPNLSGCFGSCEILWVEEEIQGSTYDNNPFTLRVSLKSIVCYSHTFEDNFGINQKFIKYLK